MRSGKEGLEMLQLLETRVGYFGETNECRSDGCDRLEDDALSVGGQRTSNAAVETRSRV